MSVLEKLSYVQTELKAPKGSYNSFGKYKYRSCEDILEAAKPLLAKQKASLVLSDSIELIGYRYYVKATAQFVDTETGEKVENSAYARESIDKKGMDDSQITGATSSYARKYALNGLFLIDDTKDADTDEYQNQQNKANKKEQKSDEALNKQMEESVNKNLVPEANEKITAAQLELMQKEMNRTGVSLQQILGIAKVNSIDDMSQATAVSIINKLGRTKSK